MSRPQLKVERRCTPVLKESGYTLRFVWLPVISLSRPTVRPLVCQTSGARPRHVVRVGKTPTPQCCSRLRRGHCRTVLMQPPRRAYRTGRYSRTRVGVSRKQFT
jgi:hypothetical protein